MLRSIGMDSAAIPPSNSAFTGLATMLVKRNTKRFVAIIAMSVCFPALAGDPKPPTTTPGQLPTRDQLVEAFRNQMLKDPKFRKEFEEATLTVRWRIVQITDSGALVRLKAAPRDPAVFLFGGFPTLVDGDDWRGTVYPAGTYKYTNTTGARSTVRAYATDKDFAFQRFIDNMLESFPKH